MSATFKFLKFDYSKIDGFVFIIFVFSKVLWFSKDIEIKERSETREKDPRLVF
jgi:hypothetical protein